MKRHLIHQEPPRHCYGQQSRGSGNIMQDGCSSQSQSSSPLSSRSSSASSLYTNNNDGMMPYSSTNRTMSRTTTTTHSIIDCDFSHNLGLSLKRVKISTSPGELRVTRDMEQLRTEHGWQSVKDDADPKLFISPNGVVRLERDQVDPLRLRIRILSSSSASTPAIEWVFLIHIPRMYPHSPPVIYRISQVDGAMNASADVSPSILLSVPPPNPMDDQDDGDEAVMSSFPLSQRYRPPLFASRIVVSQDHPLQQQQQQQENGRAKKNHNNCIVYRNWSPISTLHDLISWLSFEIVPTWNASLSASSYGSNFGPKKHDALLRQNRFDVGYDKDSAFVLGMDVDL